MRPMKRALTVVAAAALLSTMVLMFAPDAHAAFWNQTTHVLAISPGNVVTVRCLAADNATAIVGTRVNSVTIDFACTEPANTTAPTWGSPQTLTVHGVGAEVQCWYDAGGSEDWTVSGLVATVTCYPPPTTTTTTTAPPPPPFPTTATTGVPSGTTLTASGSITAATAGQVIDSKLVTGCINIQANNVTVKNTRVLFAGGGCTGEGIRNASFTGLTVTDTEVDGQNDLACTEALGLNNYTLTRVYLHGCTDGARINSGNVTIRDSYIGPEFYHSPDHDDGGQCYYSSSSLAPYTANVIQHNTIVGGNNAAVQLADYCHGSLLFDDNWLSATGGYQLRLYDFDATVTNNHFLNGAWQQTPWVGGPVAYFTNPGGSDPGATIVGWSGNVIVDAADNTISTVPQPT